MPNELSFTLFFVPSLLRFEPCYRKGPTEKGVQLLYEGVSKSGGLTIFELVHCGSLATYQVAHH